MADVERLPIEHAEKEEEDTQAMAKSSGAAADRELPFQRELHSFGNEVARAEGEKEKLRQLAKRRLVKPRERRRG